MEFIVAILTPFFSDGGIDKQGLLNYLGFLHRAGVRTILLQGTTGEFAALGVSERFLLIRFVRAAWQGRLLVNISDDAVENALLFAAEAENCRADGVVLLPPPACGEDGAAVEHYFERVLSRVRLPVNLYNYPKQIGTVLSPETVDRLMRRFPQICGLKDSAGSVESIRGFRDACPTLRLYVGNDLLAPFAGMHGCAGWISGACGAFPDVALRMMEAVSRGEETEVRYCFRIIQRWNVLLHQGNGSVISGIKLGVSAQVPGFGPYCRPPIEARSDRHRIVDFVSQPF